MYRLRVSTQVTKLKTTLLSSGAILREALAAAELLEKDFGVSADVWSVTSFNELKRDAEKIARQHCLSLDYTSKSYLTECLEQMSGPIVAATDYIRAYPEQIRAYVKTTDYHVLGTDGFGRSDTREALRRFFEVDRHYIAYAAIVALVQRGELPIEKAQEAKKKYAIDENKPHPITV